jgi:hypothetical protein
MILQREGVALNRFHPGLSILKAEIQEDVCMLVVEHHTYYFPYAVCRFVPHTKFF